MFFGVDKKIKAFFSFEKGSNHFTGGNENEKLYRLWDAHEETRGFRHE